MIVGIVYRYISPSGKSYIGQTTNEAHRRATWFCTKQHYAGEAIDAARAKYGPENFQYEVLHKKYYFNHQEATEDLDKWECYYIGYYDSYRNGYNLTLGGDINTRGLIRTEKWKERQRKAHQGKIPNEDTRRKLSQSLTGKKHSKEARESSKIKRRTSGLCVKIGQYDKELKLVKIWSNGAEAAETLKINSANIYRAIRTSGMYMGFYWRKYNGEQTIKLKPRKEVKRPTLKKRVVQLDKEDNVIQTFDGVVEAAKAMGANNIVLLSRVLNGRGKTAYGYKWKFLNCA